MDRIIKQVEKQKFDLTDLIEGKFLNLRQIFDIELNSLQQSYRSSIQLVNAASSNLGDLYKDKMLKIKSKISSYFGKCDVRVDEIQQEVYSLASLVRTIETSQSQVGKHDAHIYSLNEVVK
jgi:hypothetical protein